MICPIPDPALPWDYQGDVMVLAATVYGEAEGEPLEGKLAVCWVVMNRVADPRWPDTVSEVCFQPLQFSAFNHGSVRLAEMLAPHGQAWDESFFLSCDVIRRKIPDPVSGANHYCVKTLEPSWAKDKPWCAEIHSHRFWKL